MSSALGSVSCASRIRVVRLTPDCAYTFAHVKANAGGGCLIPGKIGLTLSFLCMKYFLDAEFIESGTRKTIDLVSIGIVAGDGRKYYAISDQFNPKLAVDPVAILAINKLPERPEKLLQPQEESPRRWEEGKLWKSLESIKQDLLKFIVPDENGIIFWGAWSAYDWVAFCQLFGDMRHLPKGYPYYCNDVIQWMTQLGLSREFLPPDPENAHNALADAQWTKEAYYALKQYADNQQRRRSDGKPVEFKDGSH